MNAEQLKDISDKLCNARITAKPVEQFSETVKDFTRQEAYQIQESGMEFRINSGEKSWFKNGTHERGEKKANGPRCSIVWRAHG